MTVFVFSDCLSHYFVLTDDEHSCLDHFGVWIYNMMFVRAALCLMNVRLIKCCINCIKITEKAKNSERIRLFVKSEKF